MEMRNSLSYRTGLIKTGSGDQKKTGIWIIWIGFDVENKSFKFVSSGRLSSDTMMRVITEKFRENSFILYFHIELPIYTYCE